MKDFLYKLISSEIILAVLPIFEFLEIAYLLFCRALFIDKFGIKIGLVDHGGTMADMRIKGKNRDFQNKLTYMSLPALLKNIGFYTVMVSPFRERHSAWWFYAGFNEVFITREKVALKERMRWFLKEFTIFIKGKTLVLFNSYLL